jgi:uncharacterized protein
MRRWTTLGGLAVGVFFVVVLVLHGQPRAEPLSETKGHERKVSASGTATVRVKPDSARIFFGVETTAKTIKEARDQNSQETKKVLDVLRALKMPNLKMKTSTVSVEIVKKYSNEAPEIAGYRLTNSFTVLITTDDPQKLGQTAGQVLDAALEAGANQVQQVAIFRQDTTEVKRQALALAVREAKANAQALAEGAKAEIKDTIEINDQPRYYFGFNNQSSNISLPGGGLGEETPVVAGEVEVTCHVNVTCTY